MCGIAGIVTSDEAQSSQSSFAMVRRMTDSLAHRGPDGEGITSAMPTGSGGHVVLGHRRLSIVDIAGGGQPMKCSANELWLTFNGEIYNFKELRTQLIAAGYEFATHSDTEVVLAAYRHYGADCVKLFNGMFSLAIWDCEKHRLFMARDPFGKKPFFYRQDGKGFQFASEIKAFSALADSQKLVLDVAALKDCSMLRYVPGENTLFDKIYKLEPGTFAFYYPESRELQTNRFYHLPDSQPKHENQNANKGGNSTHKQFLALLDDCVASRINCDVPFGAFLSGGIDSTVVVALMSKHMTNPVKTFSIGFEQKELSELDSARLVADIFQTDHHEKVIKPEDFIAYLPEAIFYRDGPVSEPSDIPILLLSKMASLKVKMVLTGEGSDEVLGGYPKHAYEKYSTYTAFLPARIRKMLRKAVRLHLPARHEKIKCALISLLADSPSDRMQRWFGSTDLDIRDQLHTRWHQSSALQPNADRFQFAGGSALRNILAFDQSVWLPNNLLERGDRMTMAAGLEARMPFLDTRLAQFVSQLPDCYRVSGRTTKLILRNAAKEVIPEEIIQRKKLGFKVPMEEWFRSSLSDYLHGHIVAPGACLHEFMRADVIETLFDEHINRRQNNEKILWSLLNIELFLRQLDGTGIYKRKNTVFAPDQVSSTS